LCGKEEVLTTDIAINEIETKFEPMPFRTPLKFGAVVIESWDFCRVRCGVSNGRGRSGEGWGGIFMADGWAWPKSPPDSPTKVSAMREIAREFGKSLVKSKGHPLEILTRARPHLEELRKEKSGKVKAEVPVLAALVAGSAVDAAVHDAFGVVNGIPTYDGYGPDFVDHDLSRYLGPKYRGRYLAHYLRGTYEPTIPIVHLVGGLDKLRESEIEDSDPRDGRPVSLDQYIRREGIFCLKVKLRGNDVDWDIERLVDVHRLAEEVLPPEKHGVIAMTADANEICPNAQYAVEMLLKVKEKSPRTYDAIQYVEQPTSRDMESSPYDVSEIARLKPVLLDEGLISLEALDRALSLGWSGPALKTCKGQTEALLTLAKAEMEGLPYSVQDLTNPSIALIHSVGFAARIHCLVGVESNARQFVRDYASEEERRVHPGIFAVRDGVVDTRSLTHFGLGYGL
jgi:L-alanine-DL-glutamate epimerase-like enolase superfamily enzyme